MPLLRELYALHLLLCQLECGSERREQRLMLILELQISQDKRARIRVVLMLLRGLLLRTACRLAVLALHDVQ